jgi:Domain of unknown function (DUF1996)
VSKLVRAFATLSLVAAVLAGGPLPPQASAAKGGSFIVRCGESHQRQVDPIVAPGSPMSAHMHEFFGNMSTDFDSTYDTMIQAPTTCGFAADTSAYWFPTLMAPDGTVATAQSVNAYYRKTSGAGAHVVAFPPDFRMVERGHYFFGCGNLRSQSLTPPNCGKGFLRLTIDFPSCWDGQNIDSANHIDHVTFASGTSCTGVFVPKLRLVVKYGVKDATGYGLSSDAGAGVTDGQSAHADFWNTWNQDALAAEVDACINAGIRCGVVTYAAPARGRTASAKARRCEVVEPYEAPM